jgi:Spy/CpxP family protein refolding chaperone
VKRNWLLYLVIFSLALNFGTIGTFLYLRSRDQAQMFSWKTPPPLPMRVLWRDLKLDAGQRQAVHRMFPKHRAMVEEYREALFQKRQELFKLLKAQTPDMAAIRAKVGEISALQGQLEEELVRHFLAFKKLLKPEQNEAFLKLVQTRIDRGGCGPFGPHGPGRGPRLGPGRPPPPPGMGPGPPPPPPGMGPGRGMGPGQGE